MIAFSEIADELPGRLGDRMMRHADAYAGAAVVPMGKYYLEVRSRPGAHPEALRDMANALTDLTFDDMVLLTNAANIHAKHAVRQFSFANFTAGQYAKLWTGQKAWIRKSELVREDGTDKMIAKGTRVIVDASHPMRQAVVYNKQHGVTLESGKTLPHAAKAELGTTDAWLVRLDPVHKQPEAADDESFVTRKHPPLNWVTTRADRDGKPTERQARLPRLMYPGMAVVDYCGGSGSKDGRYVLLYRKYVDGREVWNGANAFKNLDELWAFLQP